MKEFNWKKCLTKRKKRTNCWIAPNGDWYNVKMTDHEEFAQSYMKNIYGEGYDYRKAGPALLEKGWIEVRSDYITGTSVVGSEHMTPDQYMVLLKYWKNNRLFRGWTIEMLWKESKYNDSRKQS